MRVIFCGGRTYHDAARIAQELDRFDPLDTTILTGGAQGADHLAEKIALERGFVVVSHYADWKQYGKRAGPLRNQEMVDTGVDMVVAFPGGPGTRDMVRRARNAGVEVREVEA